MWTNFGSYVSCYSFFGMFSGYSFFGMYKYLPESERKFVKKKKLKYTAILMVGKAIKISTQWSTVLRVCVECTSAHYTDSILENWWDHSKLHICFICFLLIHIINRQCIYVLFLCNRIWNCDQQYGKKKLHFVNLFYCLK